MNEDQCTPKLWTTLQVAQYVGCTVRHIQNLMVTGLSYIKVGRLVRFDPVEVMEFLRKKWQIQDSETIE